MQIDTLLSSANCIRHLMNVTTCGIGSMSTCYSALVKSSTWTILASSVMGTKASSTQSTRTSRRPSSSSVHCIWKFTLANMRIQLTNTCTTEWQEWTMKVYSKSVRCDYLSLPGNILWRQQTNASTCFTAKLSRAAQLSLCLKVSMPQVSNQNKKIHTRSCN